MTPYFETAKHLKKRHFIKQVPTLAQKKIAVFKGTIESSNIKEGIVKQSKPTVTTPASDVVATPVMAVKREINDAQENKNVHQPFKEITAKKIHWREPFIQGGWKLVDVIEKTLHALCNHFKRG